MTATEVRTLPVRLGDMVVLPSGVIAPESLREALTPTERRLLIMAAQRYPGCADEADVFAAELGYAAWDGARRSLAVHVCRVNRKLAPYGARLINVTKLGYRLAAL